MPYRLIAQGSPSDIDRIGQYQDDFEEGSSGYVELELRSGIAVDVILWLQNRLRDVGVADSRVELEGRSLKIHFKTEIAPLILIAAAIAACIFLLGIVIAWKLFKLSPAAVIGISLGLILAIAGAVVAISILGSLVVGSVRLGR